MMAGIYHTFQSALEGSRVGRGVAILQDLRSDYSLDVVQLPILPTLPPIVVLSGRYGASSVLNSILGIDLLPWGPAVRCRRIITVSLTPRKAPNPVTFHPCRQPQGRQCSAAGADYHRQRSNSARGRRHCVYCAPPASGCLEACRALPAPATPLL